tara:strand:- start:41858 stop:43243 length:1386 start_codon:yes stop_codon:yes gene_type:complete
LTNLFDLPVEPPTPLAKKDRHVWAVSELTIEIRNFLELKFQEIWVEGEISNARVWKTGHLYFTLKDASSQLRGVMFRSAVRAQRFKVNDGQQVIVRGRISVYEPKGEYQIICEHIEPHGVGALQLAFDQLKKQLGNEGLFDDKRKKTLPLLPRKIGIVTSTDGAALKDITNVLRRRHPNLHLVVSPTRVQGEQAEAEIVQAITRLEATKNIDVIILTRGGGSIEDLQAFNTENVARAIVNCEIPTISAVGHETDYTISDFVSDLRAPTPSAAAELVIKQKTELITRIGHLIERMASDARHNIQHKRSNVHHLETATGFMGLPSRVAMRGRKISETTHQLKHLLHNQLTRSERRLHELTIQLETLDIGRQLSHVRNRLLKANIQLINKVKDLHHKRERRLHETSGRLDTLSPLAVLARGYSVCWNSNQSLIISNSDDVVIGQDIHVKLHHGTLDCKVKRATK